MPDINLSDLGADLERGIDRPPFERVRARYASALRRRRRRNVAAIAAGTIVVAAGVAAAVAPGGQGRPATLSTGTSPQADPKIVEPKGVSWLRVVIDRGGQGFAIGADCGSGRPFCRYVIRHTADDAVSWQPVPAPSGLIPNPGRFQQEFAAATDGKRLWLQGFPTLMTGTVAGHWVTLPGPVADFGQNSVVAKGVIVERSFPATSPCGQGVALMTATGFQALPHQPRKPYQTDVTAVAPDGSLWEISPAYPTACVLKLGQQVHGKVISRAAGPAAGWSPLRPAPDMTTTSFRALSSLTAVSLLTSRNLSSYDARIELKLVSTTDGGQTWKTTDLHQQSTYDHENGGGVLNAFDIGHLLISTDAGVEASADGGMTFRPAVTPAGGDRITAISITGSTTAFTVSARGVVMATDDAGLHWTERSAL